MTDPRYPIGEFSFDGALSEQEKSKHLDHIEQTPARMRAAVHGLSEKQLDTPYRDGGWTVRQVVHHVPDSHMNAYVRFKLALTEEEPTIRPYMEKPWAELPEAKSGPVELSLELLESLHKRWILTLRNPEMGVLNLEKTLALYSWHGRHHVAQVTSRREKMGWWGSRRQSSVVS